MYCNYFRFFFFFAMPFDLWFPSRRVKRLEIRNLLHDIHTHSVARTGVIQIVNTIQYDIITYYSVAVRMLYYVCQGHSHARETEITFWHFVNPRVWSVYIIFCIIYETSARHIMIFLLQRVLNDVFNRFSGCDTRMCTSRRNRDFEECTATVYVTQTGVTNDVGKIVRSRNGENGQREKRKVTYQMRFSCCRHNPYRQDYNTERSVSWEMIDTAYVGADTRCARACII